MIECPDSGAIESLPLTVIKRGTFGTLPCGEVIVTAMEELGPA